MPPQPSCSVTAAAVTAAAAPAGGGAEACRRRAGAGVECRAAGVRAPRRRHLPFLLPDPHPAAAARPQCQVPVPLYIFCLSFFPFLFEACAPRGCSLGRSHRLASPGLPLHRCPRQSRGKAPSAAVAPPATGSSCCRRSCGGRVLRRCCPPTSSPWRPWPPRASLRRSCNGCGQIFGRLRGGPRPPLPLPRRAAGRRRSSCPESAASVPAAGRGAGCGAVARGGGAGQLCGSCAGGTG